MAVPLTGTIATYAGGLFATHDALTGLDGWRSVADATARNAIVSGTPLRCRQGMAVWTQGDSALWTLNAPPWAGDDTDWTEYAPALVISPVAACRVAATGALNATYANGSSGVGATLTNAGSQAAIAVDGVTLDLTDRVLVQDQYNTYENGIYSVTTLGSGSTNWVLTRTTDYDTADLVAAGTYTVIYAGTTNANTLWIETAIGPFTIGTTAIVFTMLTITGLGTVTSVSVETANGFAGSVVSPSTLPEITISTTITGMIKGDGTAILEATADTDYQAPITLTTTGSSGAATFSGGTLNIPEYSGGSGSGRSPRSTPMAPLPAARSPRTERWGLPRPRHCPGRRRRRRSRPWTTRPRLPPRPMWMTQWAHWRRR